MALGGVTDFVLVQNGEELTSDNRRLSDWLMLGDDNDRRIAGCAKSRHKSTRAVLSHVFCPLTGRRVSCHLPT